MLLPGIKVNTGPVIENHFPIASRNNGCGIAG